MLTRKLYFISANQKQEQTLDVHLSLHFLEVSNFDVRFSFLEFELLKLIRNYWLMVFQTSNSQNQLLTLTGLKNGPRIPGRILRVVHTQAILFLKSMSERGGSDIERL